MRFGLFALGAFAVGCGLARTPDDASGDGGDGGDGGIDAPARTGFHPCDHDEDCLARELCQTSLCAGPPRGYCVDRSRGVAACYARGHGGCGDPSLYCLDDSQCAVDSYGVCLTPAELDDVCAHQPTHWACPSNDAGPAPDAWLRSDAGPRVDAGAASAPCDLSGPSVAHDYDLPVAFTGFIVTAGVVGDHWTLLGFCNDDGEFGPLPDVTSIAYAPLDGRDIETLTLGDEGAGVLGMVHGRFVLWDSATPDVLGAMDENGNVGPLSAPGWSWSATDWRFVDDDVLWVFAFDGVGYRITDALTGHVRVSHSGASSPGFAPAHGGIFEVRQIDSATGVLAALDAAGTLLGQSAPFALGAQTRFAFASTASGIALVLTDFSPGADPHHAIAHARLRFFDTVAADVGVETVLDDTIVGEYAGAFSAATMTAGRGDDVVVSWSDTQLHLVSIAPDGRRGRAVDLPMPHGAVFRDGDAILVVSNSYGTCDVARAWIGNCR